MVIFLYYLNIFVWIQQGYFKDSTEISLWVPTVTSYRSSGVLHLMESGIERAIV